MVAPGFGRSAHARGARHLRRAHGRQLPAAGCHDADRGATTAARRGRSASTWTRLPRSASARTGASSRARGRFAARSSGAKIAIRRGTSSIACGCSSPRRWNKEPSVCPRGCSTSPAASPQPRRSSSCRRSRPPTAASTSPTCRDEALRLLDSVQETIRIGEEAGIPVQMTHHKAISRDMWGRSADSLGLVDAARARGGRHHHRSVPPTPPRRPGSPRWCRSGRRRGERRS